MLNSANLPELLMINDSHFRKQSLKYNALSNYFEKRIPILLVRDLLYNSVNNYTNYIIANEIHFSNFSVIIIFGWRIIQASFLYG